MVFFTACIPGKKLYTPERKYSPEQLKEDASVLWKTFQQCHPSLYWYTPKDSLDPAFEGLIGSLEDSLTELEFRNRLSETIALIHCGHTSVRSSKAAMHYKDKNRSPFFPLHVKTWDGDSMIILANAFRNDSVLVRGTSIQRINGRPVREIVDAMSRYISADGLHNSFKYQLISSNFPAWYKSIVGLSDNYQLSITTLNGERKTISIKNYDPVYQDSIRKAGNKTLQDQKPTPPRRIQPRWVTNSRLEDLRKFTIDTARSLGVMELGTFSNAHLPRFFRRSFRKLRRYKIANLAIELRENGGGNIINSTKLARYLSDHPFKVADSVYAKSLDYPFPFRVKNGIFYKIQSWFATTRQQDGKLHYRMYEKKEFSPYKRNHFAGQVFIITGGFTFSASTLFINPLKGQKNVFVVGEETGGGAYGNSAVNVPELCLPNSHLRVRLPLYRLVVNKELPHDGRGILPDVWVPATSWHLANRVDPKMQKIYQIINSEDTPKPGKNGEAIPVHRSIKAWKQFYQQLWHHNPPQDQ